jgi:GrpB-like predicted nucleotidyltransferase (UPF0157 family)
MVEIIPYQKTWPQEFQIIAVKLRKALGPLALRIDHIGSTSVPGLAAKDVIDIQITVLQLDDPVIQSMIAAGYQLSEQIGNDHIPPEFKGSTLEWQKLFFNPPAGQRRTNTHMRVSGRANQRYPILFRDYLRTHPATAKAYAELKKRLADHLAESETYPFVKDPAVDLIYFAAEDWAALNGWQMGPSDA